MFRSENGFTLVETIVAAGIATAIAYASFSVFPFLRMQMASSRGSAGCAAYLDQNFARIELWGTSPKLIDSPPLLQTNIVKVPLQTPIYDVTSTSLTPKYGQSVVDFVDSNSPTVIRTAGLYTSSVLLMNALYGNNASICAGVYHFPGNSLSASSTPPTLLTPPTPDVSDSFDIQMQVQPYDLKNRTLYPSCNYPNADQNPTMQVGPKGFRVDSTEAEAAIPAVATMDHRNNLGFKVTLTASYLDHGVARSCSQNRLIEYTGDMLRPTTPSGAVTTTHVFSPTAYGPALSTIVLSFNGNKDGVTLMCRDLSTFTPPPFNPLKTPGSYLGSISPHNGAWVPCDHISACGVTPSSPGTWVNLSPPSTKNFAITNTWSGAKQLIYGCNISIEVVAVDAAGNLSLISPVTYVLTDP